MTQVFDTGTPASGADLRHALGALLATGTAYLAGLPDSVFFAPQGSAWPPADHVRHLHRSATPVALALTLPRWLLAIRFGRGAGQSRSFAEMREVYRAALARGAKAGRFAPAPEGVPADPAARRNEIMNDWARATVGLQNAVARWPEKALDRQPLPHPVLGPLTVREMLAFTVYHTAHHLGRVAERAGD
ncbi:MAG TPA: DinB family protein [Gemmatimonadales bacterium]